MHRPHPAHLIVALAFAGSAGVAHAQGATPIASPEPTSSTARSLTPLSMDSKEFLRTHRWDEPTDAWVLKAGIDVPSGIKPRSEVKAERDAFLRRNQYNEGTDTWMPRKVEIPAGSTMTRAQVRSDALAFERTHHWDEGQGRWLMNPEPMPKMKGAKG
jgi:hypothetical protein